MIQELSDTELETYARQIALEDIDYHGQLKIRNARACVVGLGGLGSLIAPKLVGMGVGYLRLVDRDIVSRSDLHRQYLYDVDCVGLPKVEMATRRLSRLNPDVTLEPVPESFNSINAEDLVHDVDLVLDGLDRPEPRYLLNRACLKHNVPYLFGAALEASGNLTTVMPGRSVCLECIMPGLKDEEMPRCAVVGVHPSVLGLVTALQVSEAVRVMVGQEPHLLNKLFYIDLRALRFHTIRIERSEECPVCGSRPTSPPPPLRDKLFEETCARDGRRNFILSPATRLEVPIEQLTKLLFEPGLRIQKWGSLGVAFETHDGLSVSLLKSGTMIVQSPPRPEDMSGRVHALYRSLLVETLGIPENVLPDGSSG